MSDPTNRPAQPGERFTGHGAEWKPANLSAGEAATATAWVEQQHRPPLDADQQGSRRGRARYHVAARKGRPDRRPSHHRSSTSRSRSRRSTAGPSASRRRSSGTTRAAASAATSPAIPSLCCGCRTSSARAISTRPTRPRARRGTTTAPASATSRASPPSSCATSIRPTSRPRRRDCRKAITIRSSTAARRSATTRKCAPICMHSAKLRESVTKILGKLGRLVDGKLLIPEEVVHYSEWLHVMRRRIARSSGRSTLPASARRSIRRATSTRWCRRTRSTTTTFSKETASRCRPD